jgi:hypothetical protein
MNFLNLKLCFKIRFSPFKDLIEQIESFGAKVKTREKLRVLKCN